ncbi:hypothetical protein FGO68_gene13165 [Halteria grandinella]|uniref:Uncharacterized protein n=1 Tax=Halteria grandinella TaxID=5974 RepID=A0A8J8NM31_HALGN|nr:hypothetical protein FGO68_gene13165 [Halteria grandinella]
MKITKVKVENQKNAIQKMVAELRINNKIILLKNELERVQMKETMRNQLSLPKMQKPMLNGNSSIESDEINQRFNVRNIQGRYLNKTQELYSTIKTNRICKDNYYQR